MIMKFGAFAAARRVITESSCSGRRRFWRWRDREAGFRTARGSRYADPMPAAEMATWLAERKAVGAER